MKIRFIFYINSVSRVDHGCNPSALLTDPIIIAKLISGIVDTSIRMIYIKLKDSFRFFFTSKTTIDRINLNRIRTDVIFFDSFT